MVKNDAVVEFYRRLFFKSLFLCKFVLSQTLNETQTRKAMKKYLLIGLLPAFLLLGCKEDEKTVQPMKKMESVTWHKNNSPTREGAIKIIYNNEGNLSLVEEYDQSENKAREYSYVIKSASINVSRFNYSGGSAIETFPDYRTLDLSGGIVRKERLNAFNEYNGTKEAYTKDLFDYIYKGKLLSSINWTSTIADGGRYDNVVLNDAVKFEYLNGNLIDLRWSVDLSNRKKMEITYSDTPIPANLPLRFLRPLDLDTWDMLDPLNAYYGTEGIYLPSTIKIVDILSGTVEVEYTFYGSLFEGYLLDMVIERDRNGVKDTYTYTFKYKNSL